MKILKGILICFGILIALRFLAPTVLPKLISMVFNSSLLISRSQIEILIIVVVSLLILGMIRLRRHK